MWNVTKYGRAALGAALFLCALPATLKSVRAAEQGGPARYLLAAETAVKEERLDLETASGVHVLSIEVARSPEQQQLGLMFRTKLPEDKGMLFPHERPREVQMWMRNTYIPLDMVFIRKNGTVLRIEKMTEPFSERIISSNGEVTGVLEIAGGLADKLGLKPGDHVRHSHFQAQ